MTFKFNPHRHVKIWLSKDKSSFLNRLNQLRLVRMRTKNPSSSIHFIYDASLLDSNAIKQCHEFCTKHQIIPHDVNELFPCCKTAEEHELIRLYRDEIEHLEEGGNLGSASDKLRLLSPIYSLGTYSDFDVEINTEELPKELLVDKPILLHVGSYVPQTQPGFEFLSVNNDILVIVDPQEALEYIKNIQRIGIHLSGTHSREASNHPYKDANPSVSMIGIILSILATVQNPRQIRSSILKLTKTNQIFYRMFLHLDSLCPISASRVGFLQNTPQPTSEELSRIAREVLSSLLEMLRLPNLSARFRAEIKELVVNPWEEKILDFYRNYIKHELIATTVIESFGPEIYVYGLFRTNFYAQTEMAKKVNPYAIENYSFASAFRSDNGYGLHITESEKMQKLKTATNDLSWTEQGKEKLHAVEDKLEDVVKVIQASWRKRKK